MIESLSASTGLLAADPMFWMPLALFGLMLFLLAGLVVLDGFDIGCGLIMPWLPDLERSRVLDALTAWRGANESWLFLMFAVFIAAFPLGWAAFLGDLFVPILLLTTGSVLRSLAFEFRARAPMRQQPFWNGLFSVGAYGGVAGLALWLAWIVISPLELSDWVFVVLTLIAMMANCVLLATCWILTWDGTALRQRAARIANGVVRWVAAGMVAVALVLSLTNPAVYYRWTSLDFMPFGLVSWVLMLTGFVILERQLRRIMARPQCRYWWSPLVLIASLNGLMLLGLAYSFFPFLVLDELTLWDAAATRESLRWVMAAVVVVAPVLLVYNVLGYWRLFRYKPVRTD